jgi:hypothetical protein
MADFQHSQDKKTRTATRPDNIPSLVIEDIRSSRFIHKEMTNFCGIGTESLCRGIIHAHDIFGGVSPPQALICLHRAPATLATAQAARK